MLSFHSKLLNIRALPLFGPILLLVSCIVCFALTGCGGDGSFSSDPIDKPYKPRMRHIKSKSTLPCIPRAPIGKIHFDCNFTDSEYAILTQDLEYLRKINFSEASAVGIRRAFGLSTVTGESLFHWLEDNLQYLLSPTFNTVKEPYVVAQNFSNGLISKYRDPFAVLEVPGFGPVEVTSQKVGIAMLSHLFFTKRTDSPQLHVNSIEGLSTLLHEAVHSRGRGPSLGFPHVDCPAGHRDQGRNACDLCLNGAYGREILFIAAARLSSNTIGFTESHHLKEVEELYKKRVIPGAVLCDDALQFP